MHKWPNGYGYAFDHGAVQMHMRRTSAAVTEDEMDANARLIAAAPELLEALQSVEMALIGYTHQNDITRTALSKARAVIAKAIGAA